MVQSLGISVGNQNSYVAACQGGGIEILLNEYSNRSTPSMVAFTDQSRSIGVDASSNFFMNINNTIYDIMVLVGKPYKEIISMNDGSPRHIFKLEEASDGQALVVVRHLGEERKFTFTQILAMLFTKLKDVAGGASNCVISCPQFFTEDQKNALMNAALIAGLSPLQIISDTTAVVLNYVYFRTTKEDTDKLVAIVNMGQSNLQTAVAWLTPEEDVVQLLAADSEPIGGRDFDQLLAQHFVREYNLSLSPKSYLKLVAACEKLKRLLSANSNEIPLHVESLISEDKDFTARIDRATFEKLAQPLLERVQACLKRTVEVAKAQSEKDIQVVEMVGGSTRVPAIKQLVQDVFNLPPSTTLNTDEAVARGCVLHCATLHPGMKVKREVKIVGTETFFKPASLTCDKESRRVELELISSDRKYRSRIEARNNLEEYIYAERSRVQEGDHLDQLSGALDWLSSEEGEDASEDAYVTRLNELKDLRKAIDKANEKANAKANAKQAEAEKADEKVEEKGDAKNQTNEMSNGDVKKESDTKAGENSEEPQPMDQEATEKVYTEQQQQEIKTSQ